MGLGEYVNTLAEDAGTDKLIIQAKSAGGPGTDDTFYLSRDDIDYIDDIRGVKEIAALYMKPAEIKYDKESTFYYLTAWDRDKNDLVLESFTVEIIKGRGLDNGETGKVTLGYLYQFDNKIFKKGLDLGQKVEIGGEELDIVGFYKEVGNPADDANIYVTNKQFEKMYPEDKDKFGYAMIQAASGVEPSDLEERIEDKLRKYKDQEEGKEDFFVQTFEDALATFTAVTDILNGILVLIALISLVVAFVNIMNTMYTSVTERTKEIGIMKAIGATKGDILSIFLFESGFLGFLGGLFGVLLGYLMSSAGGQIAASAGFSLLKPVFPPVLIIGCLAFATFVGLLSGVLPANQASKLNPVDALRYE